MVSRAKILLIDDDPQTAFVLFPALAREGYDTLLANDATSGLELALRRRRLDLILLEIALSEGRGMTLLEAIRSRRAIPLIVLSTCSSEAEKARALDLGADDYITKPFGLVEVLARIRGVLRRSLPPPPPSEHGAIPEPPALAEETYTFGDVVVDPALRRVRKRGRAVALTVREFNLLVYLLRSRHRVVSNEMIVKALWPQPPRARRGRPSSTVGNVVQRLRRKLEDDPKVPEYVVTVRGSGYRFEG
ncbi:MAG TPA: response regulator transcription factor [Polyangiaceae bacterium]|nr:response regulator transcription factor [Polyangiaceae bacterium]